MSQNPDIVSLSTRIGAAAAADESRYAMSSVHVRRRDGDTHGHAIATDGRVLALARVDVPAGTSIYLPAKACDVRRPARGPAPVVQIVGQTARVGAKAYDMPEQGRTFPPYVDVIPNGTAVDGARFVRVAFNPELIAELARALTDQDNNAGAAVVEMVFQVDAGGTATTKPALVVGRAERGAAAGVAMLCAIDGKAQTAAARAEELAGIARRIAHGEAHPWEERKAPAPASTPNPCAAALALAEARAAT